MAFDFEKVRSILVCPSCRNALVLDESKLVCTNADERLQFPIVDDIPRLLVDEATTLAPQDWRKIMDRHASH